MCVTYVFLLHVRFALVFVLVCLLLFFLHAVFNAFLILFLLFCRRHRRCCCRMSSSTLQRAKSIDATPNRRHYTVARKERREGAPLPSSFPSSGGPLALWLAAVDCWFE